MIVIVVNLGGFLHSAGRYELLAAASWMLQRLPVNLYRDAAAEGDVVLLRRHQPKYSAGYSEFDKRFQESTVSKRLNSPRIISSPVKANTENSSANLRAGFIPQS